MSHVFISYSKKDAAYARQLADGLLDAGFDVWIDTQQLRSGDEWWTVIYHAIQNSSAFVVVLSPNSDASEWVQDEIAVAKAFDQPVFPVLLAGDLRTPNWAKFLRIHYEDARGGSLPTEAFYGQLGEVAPRKAIRGEDVTAPEAKSERAPPVPVPPAASLRDPAPLPAEDAATQPPDEDGAIGFISDYYAAPRKARSPIPVVAAAAVVIAVLAALALLSNGGGGGNGNTPTAEHTATEDAPQLAIGTVEVSVEEQWISLLIRASPRDQFDALRFEVWDVSNPLAESIFTVMLDLSNVILESPVMLHPVPLEAGHPIQIDVTGIYGGVDVASTRSIVTVNPSEGNEAIATPEDSLTLLQTLHPPQFNDNGDELLSVANIELGYTVDSACRGFNPLSGELVVATPGSSGQMQVVSPGLTSVVAEVEFGVSPDGRYRIEGDSVIEVESGHTLFHIQGGPALFSPDSRMLVVGDDGIYDMAQAVKAYPLLGEPVAFSPDGTLLAVNDRGLCHVFWTQDNAERVGKVTIVQATVRDAPDDNAPIRTEVSSDTFTVIELTADAEWKRIILYDGDVPTGWVRTSDVASADIPVDVPVYEAGDGE